MADKPFGSIQRDPARPVGRLYIRAQLTHIQQADVERSTDTGMKQERLTLGHGILIIAKGRQAKVQKVVPQCLRIGMRHGIVKGLQRTVVVSEVLGHQRNHLTGHCIHGKARRQWSPLVLGQRLAVVCIKVPGPSDRAAVAIDEQPALAPHLAIEKLHAQLLFAFGPGSEFGATTQETAINMPVDRQVTARE